MEYSKIAKRLRGQIAEFSGEVSVGLGKVGKRFVSEMVYGIQASESVVLTEIARTLEEPISIKKTEGRLSNNLRREGIGAVIQKNVLSKGSALIKEDTLIIVDPSDLRKKYAEKMEYLDRVRDGSEKELANGYWTLHVVATELDSDDLVPLYQSLYSASAPTFVSENDEILRAVDQVSVHVKRRGLWIMDRGGDRIKLFRPLLDRRLRFLIRLRGDRNLEFDRQRLLASEIAAGCPCPYAETIVKNDDGKEKVYHLEFGFRKVRLPKRKEQLYLLVVHGFGLEPLMLLTNAALRRSRKALWRMVRAYLRRWSVEETIRFVKQTYDLENIRVLRYQGLQNMMPLLLAVMYFAMVVLDTKQKLKVMAGYVLKAAKRVFGIPDFKYYAVADGMRSIFARHPGRPQRLYKPPDGQLSLFNWDSS